jgi:hypothetical protein
MSSRAITALCPWKKAYIEAILEADPIQIPTAVHRARIELSKREHDLGLHKTMRLVEPDQIEFEQIELEEISDARYMLKALLSSVPYRDPTAA